MRLKSIKLAGFKSFVDPTTVPLQSNMTAVVGPNGCGKSNIIDAVRWVMGESSARHLRGESMADVIFNGSVSRKPVSRASIELVFDNTEGRVTSEYAKFHEISVRREVTREGLSKYYLNGAFCRRRDVTDLFLGTGLGPRSYAIIEQGMISRIIEAKPEELRTYVEEAAGVSKYKERRRETENRILRTRENLDRLNDLTEELGRQLEKLKRQADAAERFKKLKQQSRLFEALSLSHQLNDRRENNQLHEITKNEFAQKIERLASQSSTNEREKIIAQVQRDDANSVLDEANAAYYANAATLSRLEANKEAHDKQAKQASISIEKAGQDIRSLQKTIQSDTLEGTEARKRQDSLALDLENIEVDLLAIEEKIKINDAQLFSQEELQSQISEDMGRIDSGITRCEIERQALERQQQTDSSRLLEIGQALQSLSDTDPETILKLQEAISELEMRLSQSQVALEQEEIAESTLRDDITRCELEDRLALDAVNRCEIEFTRIQRIIDIESRIDDVDIELWVNSEPQILGRAHELIRLNTDDQEAFERAFPHWLRAFVVIDLGAVNLNKLPPSVRIVSKAKIEKLPSELKKTKVPLGGSDYGYTADGIKYGPGWAERVSGDVSGILQFIESQPARQRELSELEDCSQKLARILAEKKRYLDTAVAAVKLARENFHRAESDLIRTKNILLGVQAKGAEVEISRQRLDREESDLIQAASDLVDEVGQLDKRLSESKQIKNTLQDQLSPLEKAIDQNKYASRGFRDELNRLANIRSDLRVQIERLDGICQRSQAQVERTTILISQLVDERHALEAASALLAEPPSGTTDDLQHAISESQRLEDRLKAARLEVTELDENLRGLESDRHRLDSERSALNEELSEAKLRAQAVEIEVERLQSELTARNLNMVEILQLSEQFNTLQATKDELDQLYVRINRLGPINLVALDEYQRELQRKSELDHQHAELTEALDTLEIAIRKIDRETRALFKQTFDSLNVSFGELFPQLFGGGEAWLALTDDDLLSTGVTIMARPPGKRNSSIYLLSGGEKALTALSLVFAIFQLNPAPFCLLDEVDAPLDDANVGRYADAIAEMSERVQFIFISHNKIAMERAEQLMGVTMSEPGVSRLVSVDIDRAVALAAE